MMRSYSKSRGSTNTLILRRRVVGRVSLKVTAIRRVED
jgi:hypothetical protein